MVLGGSVGVVHYGALGVVAANKVRRVQVVVMNAAVADQQAQVCEPELQGGGGQVVEHETLAVGVANYGRPMGYQVHRWHQEADAANYEDPMRQVHPVQQSQQDAAEVP